MPTIQVHPIKFMKQFVRKMPTLWSRDIHLNSTLNTTQTCRVCRGSQSDGTIAIKSDHTNTMTVTQCWFCGGTREMSNKEGAYDRN